MIDLGPHAVFIVSAYLGVAVSVAGLIVRVMFDARRTARTLSVLEAANPRRSAE